MFICMRKIQLKNLEKIGRLTPIRSLERTNHRNRILWLFKCDCGNEIEIAASDVRQGRKSSCGCLYVEHKKNCGHRLRITNTKPNQDGPITKLFGIYKRQSIKRGYEWSITKNEFLELIKFKCFYCGSLPKSEIYIARQKNKDNTLVYNGIDRKHNNLGYTQENCLTACGSCNRMKMDMKYDEFLERVKTIYLNMRMNNE